jgi:tetratricopeptide (TPR) repeat protein
VQPNFQVTNEELPFVLKICRLVQGLPLGLELAAVWIRTMSPDEIAQAIEENLDFLSSSSRNVHERHRGLRATFEYSWNLLCEKERDVLKKLAVFQGGVSREAATVVASANGALLAALVDKSLLYVVAKGRYDFHPLVAQYAREKLAEHPEEYVQTGAKHAAFFLSFAEAAAGELRGTQQGVWLERLETERDNLRSVLAWSLAHHETETGLRLANALWRFWWIRGYYREGYGWFTDLLEQSGKETLARALALTGAGYLAWQQAEPEVAQTRLEEGLGLARTLKDDEAIAFALNGLGIIAHERQDHDRARPFYEEALVLHRALGNKAGQGAVLNNLASIASYQGELALARTRFEAALELERELGHEGVATILNNLGLIAWRQADLTAARTLFEEALVLHRTLENKLGIAMSLNNLGLVAFEEANYTLAFSLHEKSLRLRWNVNDKWGLAYSLEALASLAAAQQNSERAARLWGAAEVLREATATPLPQNERPRYNSLVVASRNHLEEATFAAAWARGRRMGLEQAVTYALENPSQVT